eukprot:2166060-Prymnesium_polylepis.1
MTRSREAPGRCRVTKAACWASPHETRCGPTVGGAVVVAPHWVAPSASLGRPGRSEVQTSNGERRCWQQSSRP